MKLENIKKIAVLGAGVMGHGIAQSFAYGGYEVTIYSVRQKGLDLAIAHIEESLNLFVDSQIIKKEDVQEILTRITTTTILRDAVTDADFIMETIPEVLDLKQKTFQEIETYCKKDAIFASNTSHLRVSDVFSQVYDQTRVVGAHYFNPPQICPTVEVVKASQTSSETLQTTCDLMTKIKKDPVKVKKDVIGLVVNRLQTALLREAFFLVENGVVDVEDIDKAVRGSLGFRAASIGPMKMVDMGGLDEWLDCCENLFPIMNNSQATPKVLADLVAQGHTGIKSGKGFYEYAIDFGQKELDEAVKNRDQEFLERYKKHFLKL
ncbi:MAG: 3-hydroxyacyl-CoA dehydrogenase family protein [Deltaproteobacteria bacterium]|jgi:3-hydroxybutyryl-CoA dehydrogenase|nr:3-hydroxyacyl-CoA dehydrogenase family protein [Deltaproteobacteria bacterium]